MNVYYSNTTGPLDRATFDKAVAKAISLAADGGKGAAALATPGLSNLDHTQNFEESFGKQFVADLKTKKIAVHAGTRWHLMTGKIDAPAFAGGPILAPYVSFKQLSDLATAPGVTAIVYVPWTEDDLSALLAAKGLTATPL